MVLCSSLHIGIGLLIPTLSLISLGFNSCSSSSTDRCSPINCSGQIQTCNASLYYYNNSVPIEQIGLHYSVNESQIHPIQVGNRQDYLIDVRCSCHTKGRVTAYFYNTSYYVEEGQTFDNISASFYNDQAYGFSSEGVDFPAITTVPIFLPYGCQQDSSKVVVTYTVQPHDTLSDIGALSSADVDSIISMNNPHIQKPDNIYADSVRFIPKAIHGIPRPKASPALEPAAKKHKWPRIIAILGTAALISMLIVIIMLRRNQL